MELQKQKLRIAINGYRVVAVTYDRNRMPLEEESYYSYIIHEFLKNLKENTGTGTWWYLLYDLANRRKDTVEILQ
mgnify:FL=1